jgi:hypothetical protein
MTDLKKAAQQALEALENVTKDYVESRQYKHNKALTALRTAIEDAEKQEPVATVRTWHKNGDQHAELGDWELGLFKLPDGEHTLYTASPAAQEFVCSTGLCHYKAQRQPLTDEEIMQTWEGVIKYAPGEVRLKDFARAIEAAHGITGEKT